MKIRPGIEELAWVAGLLEGEGHFAYVLNGQGSGTQRVQLRMADEDVVMRAAEILTKITGNPIVIHERAPNKAHWAMQHDFQLNGENARVVMRKLLRFMSEHRRHQIITALQGRRLIDKVNLELLGLAVGSSTAAANPESEPVAE